MNLANATFYVNASIPCIHCHGSGDVTHPLWQAFEHYQKSFETVFNRVLADNERDAWWKSHGVDDWKQPDKEINCLLCYGQGHIQQRISLSQALAAINQKAASKEEASA